MAGGFTLSGGEALMQHRFAVKLFTAARGMGIHTALDTNGYYGDRLNDDELETDRPRPARHQELGSRSVTASSPAWTIAPDTGLSRGGSPRSSGRSGCASCWCPDCRTIRRTSPRSPSFAAALGNVERVDVLPFHQMGRFKWKELGLAVRARRRVAADAGGSRPRVRGVPKGGLNAY